MSCPPNSTPELATTISHQLSPINCLSGLPGVSPPLQLPPSAAKEILLKPSLKKKQKEKETNLNALFKTFPGFPVLLAHRNQTFDQRPSVAQPLPPSPASGPEQPLSDGARHFWVCSWDHPRPDQGFSTPLHITSPGNFCPSLDLHAQANQSLEGASRHQDFSNLPDDFKKQPRVRTTGMEPCCSA